VISICDIIGGVAGPTAIHQWAKSRSEWLQRFLQLDAHAQAEFREHAIVIGIQMVHKWCPLTWEASQNYRLRATALSRIELDS
jgi:thymidylate synthase ThyX